MLPTWFGYRRQGSKGRVLADMVRVLPTWFGYWPTRVGYWPTRFGYSRQGSGTADMHRVLADMHLVLADGYRYWPTGIGRRAPASGFILWWPIRETRSGRPTPDTRCMSASTRCMSASTRCMSASTRTLSPVPEPCRLRSVKANHKCSVSKKEAIWTQKS